MIEIEIDTWSKKSLYACPCILLLTQFEYAWNIRSSIYKDLKKCSEVRFAWMATKPLVHHSEGRVSSSFHREHHQNHPRSQPAVNFVYTSEEEAPGLANTNGADLDGFRAPGWIFPESDLQAGQVHHFQAETDHLKSYFMAFHNDSEDLSTFLSLTSLSVCPMKVVSKQDSQILEATLQSRTPTRRHGTGTMSHLNGDTFCHGLTRSSFEAKVWTDELEQHEFYHFEVVDLKSTWSKNHQLQNLHGHNCLIVWIVHLKPWDWLLERRCEPHWASGDTVPSFVASTCTVFF